MHEAKLIITTILKKYLISRSKSVNINAQGLHLLTSQSKDHVIKGIKQKGQVSCKLPCHHQEQSVENVLQTFSAL